MARKKKGALPELAELALRDLGRRLSGHQQYVHQVEKRRKAYLGVVERGSIADQWRSQLYPKYAQQIVEGVVANLVDDKTRFTVRPRPRVTGNQQELEQMTRGARALELLLSYQLDCSRYAMSKRALVLQAQTDGLTAAKVYWKRQSGTWRERQHIPYVNSAGDHVMNPDGTEKYMSTTVERQGFTYDDPMIEVRDTRDTIWEESATSIDNCWFIDRHYSTIEQLQELEKQGVYQNVSKLKVVGSEERETAVTDEFAHLEEELWSEDRAKGMVEILEYWTRDSKQQVTIANRAVCLTPEGKYANPFWHGKKPFVVFSTNPYMFRIPGISLVEKVIALQEYLWTLMNQRLDNISLLNNAVLFVNEMFDEELDFYPGAQNFVQSPDMVKWFTPDPAVGKVSLESEGMIKQDLIDVPGGMGFIAGANPAMDQATATGVSIANTVAQRLVAHQKQQITWAEETMGDLMLSLDQQFIDTPRMVSIVGQDGAEAIREIYPDDIQGKYHVNLDSTSESLMRQERRAEAQAKVTVALNAAPVMAAIGQPLNMRAFFEDLLRAFDTDDMEKYFSAQPQMLPAGGQSGTPNGEPSSNGVTSPLASDQNSPSNENSQSPASMMARMLATGGGPNNV